MQARTEEVSAQPLMIDITPVGCSTPEGAARVATANVANEAEQIVSYHAERITAERAG